VSEKRFSAQLDATAEEKGVKEKVPWSPTKRATDDEPHDASNSLKTCEKNDRTRKTPEEMTKKRKDQK